MQKTLIVAVTAIMLLLGGSVVYAAIPDSNSKVFTGCVGAKAGELRVINYQDGQRCYKSEKTVTWNQQGPKGDSDVRAGFCSVKVPEGSRYGSGFCSFTTPLPATVDFRVTTEVRATCEMGCGEFVYEGVQILRGPRDYNHEVNEGFTVRVILSNPAGADEQSVVNFDYIAAVSH